MRRHRPHRPIRVFFYVEVRDDFRTYIEVRELEPGEITIMNPLALNVGHVATLGLQFTDQNGNPMLTQPTPDASPGVQWSDVPGSPASATLAPNGATATETAVAAGTDTVTATASVGGVAFSASLTVNVSAAPQVLTGMEIVVNSVQ